MLDCKMTQTLPTTFLLVLTAMSTLWLLSLVRRDASIVDPFWGTGFVAVAWTAISAERAAATARYAPGGALDRLGSATVALLALAQLGPRRRST
jgi:hypothetical protein